MKLAIYGAQGYALSVYEAVRALYPVREVMCFLVTERGHNAAELGGLPVKELPAFAGELSASEKEEIEVLIATPDNVQAEIEEALENYGFRHHQRMDGARWEEMMKLFHSRLGLFRPLSALPVGTATPFLRIFQARSHKDRPLNDTPKLPKYVIPLQVGAENTETKIAALTDDTGENISTKNRNYSELSGLYWVWKNRLMYGTEDEETSAHQYYGLMQYRRIFDFSADDMLRLSDNGVDVVLPYPLPYEPDIRAHHERYLKDADWNALLQALSELQPEYAESFPEVLKQRYLYNYNVILARKHVLRDYCAFLFPLLTRVEELSEPKERDRADRYLGYMGETLETLYFMKNNDVLNITHTNCRLIV